MFQPIVDLTNGKIAGAEALARFKATPIRPPNEWFADAALAGLGVRLELSAIRIALAQVHLLPSSAFVSLNVSPTTLRSPALDELIDDGLARSVVMELTEHDHIDDYGPVNDAMANLRGRGARLAVDDAGVGFAGLHHILRLEPDFIKLDRQLITDIDTDPARRSLVRALVSFGAETNAEIIAEGIETPSELETLRELSVRVGQGYHLGRPAPLQSMEPAQQS